jgi:hypothetical protein
MRDFRAVRRFIHQIGYPRSRVAIATQDQEAHVPGIAAEQVL